MSLYSIFLWEYSKTHNLTYKEAMSLASHDYKQFKHHILMSYQVEFMKKEKEKKKQNFDDQFVVSFD